MNAVDACKFSKVWVLYKQRSSCTKSPKFVLYMNIYIMEKKYSLIYHHFSVKTKASSKTCRFVLESNSDLIGQYFKNCHRLFFHSSGCECKQHSYFFSARFSLYTVYISKILTRSTYCQQGI